MTKIYVKEIGWFGVEEPKDLVMKLLYNPHIDWITFTVVEETKQVGDGRWEDVIKKREVRLSDIVAVE